MSAKWMIRSLVVFLMTTTRIGAAAAQDFTQVLPNDFVMNDILNQQRVEAATRVDAGPSTPAAPTAVTPADTQYASSPDVTTRVKAQFVAHIRSTAGDSAADEIEVALRGSDPVAEWSAIVGGDGMRPGDVADALASYWVLNWVMANGSDSTGPQTQAVREQVRQGLQGLAALDDAARQEMAEMLMLNFLLQQTAYVRALQQGDTAMAGKLGAAAVERFNSEMGLDLRQIVLTDSGFLPRG